VTVRGVLLLDSKSFRVHGEMTEELSFTKAAIPLFLKDARAERGLQTQVWTYHTWKKQKKVQNQRREWVESGARARCSPRYREGVL